MIFKSSACLNGISTITMWDYLYAENPSISQIADQYNIAGYFLPPRKSIFVIVIFLMHTEIRSETPRIIPASNRLIR